ncbi:Glycosyl hydrolase 108 [Methylobacterium sp. ap11]|nr:Glycosyl hydrolase 108 [Methylobacterium sp. ap11]
MTASTFERAPPLVLAHKGGYVDDPADPGGATKLGVMIGALSL